MWFGLWSPRVRTSLAASPDERVLLKTTQPPRIASGVSGTVMKGNARRAWANGSLREDLAAYGCALVAFLLWGVSLPFFDVNPLAMSGFGLLSVAPLPWFIAAAVSAMGYLAFAVRGNARGGALVALHASLVAVLYGTTAVLYDYPRATWTYKHIGVVEYLLSGHGVDRSIDIYHNWPGFFLISAATAKLTGISPMTQARFAEPLCGLLIGVAVFYAVGGLTRSRRLRWGATALFTIANWIGQGYFAPQALATLLQLVFFGALLRSDVLDVEPRRWVRWLLHRLHLRDMRAHVPRSHRVPPILIALAAFGLLVTTHQLTPVATLMQVGVLVMLYRVRRWWFLGLLAVLEVGWIAFAWEYTSLHYSVFTFDVERSVRMPSASGVPSLTGMTIAQWGGPVMYGMVAMLSLGGLVNRLRRGLVPLACIALAGAPAAIFLANSYGSEALLRVYLYSLPWLALIAAMFLVGDERSMGDVQAKAPPPPRLQRWRSIRAVVVAGLLIPVTLTANFWMERSYILHKPDIDVATYSETKTPQDSFVLMVNSSYPSRLTANYPPHMITDGADAPALTTYLRPNATAEEVLLAAQRAFHEYDWRPGYLVFSPAQKAYAQMWGWLTPTEYDRAMALVRASKDYKVVFQEDGAMLAAYVGVTH